MFKRISEHFLFIVSLILLATVNVSVLLSIFDEWNSDGPYSHGFLGIIVVCYVFYLQRKHLTTITLSKRQYGFGLCCLIASLLIALVAQLSSIQQLQQLAFFSSMLSLIFCFYGWSVVKSFFVPLLMLLLILPVWNVLQFPLRELSTQAGQWGPELIGIAVDRDHFRLSTVGGMFDVEPACSGLGFFMVSALLAFCVGYFNKLSTKKTLWFLFICLVIAIIANWLRIIIIIVVGTYTEMNHFIVHDHLTFGWIVFAVCLLPLIYIARTYFDDSQKESNLNNVAHSNVNQKKETVDTSLQVKQVNKLQIITTLSILVLFIGASYWIPSRYDENYALTVPNVKNYEMVSSDKNYSPNWKPYSQGATQERFFYYTKEALGFQVYLADYIKQEQASEMIYVENYLFNKQFWDRVEDKKLALIKSKNLQETDFLLLKKSSHRYRMIASWYVINGVLTSDKKIAKLTEVKSALKGQPGATLVAVSLDFDGKDVAAAKMQLSQFIYAYLHPSEY
ncbi:exosortase C-terminal domain/associated protein EpsI [uncultured Psychromonas sp.]|uniref:exosortase C-terminal domain/associated protein EpsI n=1 Tax=uncultured Psychromonas sp. TaxID=173974 RepID=UPI00261E5EDD|nr:exosortase C-terminal domain/associated protein EpsI [uncultured Psychromonas sp.]